MRPSVEFHTSPAEYHIFIIIFLHLVLDEQFQLSGLDEFWQLIHPAIFSVPEREGGPSKPYETLFIGSHLRSN
jgi:hypothetical protein